MRHPQWASVFLCGLLACSTENKLLSIAEHLGAPNVVSSTGPLPDLRKSAPGPESRDESFPRFAPIDATFQFPLPFDYGIRTDASGGGQFLAARGSGKHNGIDFLAPLGSPLLAACSGKARKDSLSGYGRVVQLVCKLPNDLGGDEGLYVSFLYAHLDKQLASSKWKEVEAGKKIGTVGKTGNAAGPVIKPHLHLEAIIRGSEGEAMRERHSRHDKRGIGATDTYLKELDAACLSPAQFTSKGDERHERRADPFMLLMCSAKPKPSLTEPTEPNLSTSQLKWSSRYRAKGFDVDEGPVSSLSAKHPSGEPELENQPDDPKLTSL